MKFKISFDTSIMDSLIFCGKWALIAIVFGFLYGVALQAVGYKYFPLITGIFSTSYFISLIIDLVKYILTGITIEKTN